MFNFFSLSYESLAQTFNCFKFRIQTKIFCSIWKISLPRGTKERSFTFSFVFFLFWNQALVDGPCSDFPRQQIRLKKLHLTTFKIRIPHSARTATVRKAWEKADIQKKWLGTTWAKKLAAKKRVSKRLGLGRPSILIIHVGRFPCHCLGALEILKYN